MDKNYLYVFITRANYGNLVFNLNYNHSLTECHLLMRKFTNKGFGIYSILNTVEIGYLYRYKIALEKDKLKEMRGNDRHENKDYIFHTRSTPAYHINIDCEKMLSDYHTYSMPQEIINESLEREYEEWWNRPEISALLENNDLRRFYEEQYKKFGIRGRLIPVVLKNSGRAILDHEALIMSLLKGAEHFMKTSLEHENIIKNKGYGTHRKWIRNSDPILYRWHYEYKIKLMRLLKDYYLALHNPKLTFEASLLEDFGFRACRSCVGS